MKTITLPYWGQIISLVSNHPDTQTITQKPAKQSREGRSLFITRQQQNQAAVLYILDNKAEQFSLSSITLPCAMQAITKDNGTGKIVMLGHDNHLYQTDWEAKNIEKVSTISLLDSATGSENRSDDIKNSYAVAISTLHNAIVILYPNIIVAWPYKDNQVGANIVIESYPADIANSLDNPTTSNRATALATSSDGRWLVIGDKLGFVNSYQWSNKNLDDTVVSTATLSLSSRHQAHQGAVNSLCFEPISQYFFSAGADKNLYRTHVQGDLHPVDRAKASQHSQMITALCVSSTRLFTAADDKSVKSWTFDKGSPNTCKEDITKTRLLALSSYAEHSALIAVGTDQSLRFIPIETVHSEKLLPVAYVIKDGYQRINELLTDSSKDSDAAFKEGLALLQSQADNQTLDVVNRLLTAKSSSIKANQALQLVTWVATTALNKTAKVLEQLLNSTISANVRLAAFRALADKAPTAERPLQYLEQALKSSHEEIIASALQGYLQVALNEVSSQRRILPILQQALSHKLLRIRKQALDALETLLPKDSPKADLMALDCHYPDVIQAGLVRLYQRNMLTSLEVSRQLMLLKNHDNADVRQTAFYVSVLSRPELVNALKQNASQQGDTQLIRTLTDFDDFQLLRGTLLDTASEEISNNKSDSAKALAGSEQAINLTLSTQDFVSQSDTISQTDSTSAKPKTTKGKGAVTQPLTASTLSSESLEPLLQSLANPHEDISFRAAYALACLQDRRAFGSLIRLMHADDDAIIRAGVAKALGTLAMEDGKAVLPVLLDDKDAGVRQIAMQAFGKLTDSTLSWAAVGFASQHQDIHEHALALFLTKVLTDDKGSASEAVQMPAEITAILLQALNNPFTSIRLEVVKVLLNREGERSSGTAITDTIKLLQQSLYEDVHQVAIEEWQRDLLNKKSKTKSAEALNKAAFNQATITKDNSNQAVLALFFADNFAAIRQQAFDTALKNTKHLSFTDLISSALSSPYSDIKKLALTTLQAKASINQLKDLLPALVGMLADDSLELRQQALKVALALTDLQPIGLAFAEPAATHLTSDDNGANSIATTTDSIYNNHNNEALIVAALASPYPDIQLTVAQLLASNSRQSINNNQNSNDERAYAVFERYLDSAIPTQDKTGEDYKQWHQHVSQALSGLAQLAEPSKYNSLDWYDRYLHHPDADFSHLAPKLMWLVSLDVTDTTEHTDLLARWQKDERALISQSASLALAVWGDARGKYFFDQNTKGKNATTSFSNLVKPLTAIHWLQAQQGLGIAHARQLRPLFESESYAPAARLLLIFNDMQQNISDIHINAANASIQETGSPQRLIEALSFADNETAVVYANILARYPTQPQNGFAAVWQYLSDYLSRKVGSILSEHSSAIDSLAHGIKADHKSNLLNKADSIRITILASVSAPVLRQLATVISSGQQPLLQAQAIGVIAHLSKLLTHNSYNDDHEVLATLQAWQRSLHALLITTQSQNIIRRNEQINTHSADGNTEVKKNHQYQMLAFGAWLGVIREGDDYYSNNHTTNQAIRGLMWLTTQSNPNTDDTNSINEDVDWSDSVSRVLLPLLNHQDFDTRELIWNCLYQLNLPATTLAEYAMSTPYSDMVKRGLQLLLKSIESENANKIVASTDLNSAANKELISLIKTNNHSLAEETYTLLKQRLGLLPASLAALDSYCQPLLYQVVSEWQQVVIAPFAQQQVESLSSENSLKNKERNDKLMFLLQAIQTDDWQTRYRAFAQLVDFYDVLFSDSHLLDALFEFWKDSQSWSDEKQVFSLIINALQLYQRVNNTDNIKSKNLPDRTSNSVVSPNGFDSTAAKLIVDSTYSKLLGLLDYSQRKMPTLEMYQGIAELRDTDVVAALLQRLRQGFEHLPNNNKSTRQQIFDTLVTISGYDQPIEDYLDELADQRWLQRQHPRHTQVLLSLFSILMNYGDYEHAAQLLASLAWAKDHGKEVSNHYDENNNNDSYSSTQIDTAIDNELSLAYDQLPAKHTFELVKTLAYRAEKRHGSLTTLQKALINKDADVQFLAAEGLAKCGQPQGLNILMATIDYNPDGELRRRSVLAIGELMGSRSQDSSLNGDAKDAASNNAQVHELYKAYDKLIKLAEDNEHYLQDVASEALGRLAQNDSFEYSTHIFELLKSRVLNPNLDAYNPSTQHWLNGLRWLNTLAAWEQIRSYIRRYLREDMFFEPQSHAIHLLQFNDSEANKALLLEILLQSEIDSDAVIAAYAAAQKLWGNEPAHVYAYDWATIQNQDEYFLEDTEYLSLKRVVTNATIDELTIFISQHGEQLSSDTLTSLQNAIMTRTDMPKSQLVSLIDSDNTRTQDIGLRYLAQYPIDYLDKDLFATLQQQLDTLKEQWQALIDTINRSPILLSNEQWLNNVDQVATTIEQLIWLECRYLPVEKDKASLKQMVGTIASYLPGAKHKTNIKQIIETIDWLNDLRQVAITNSIGPLATTVSSWWQQLLLGLLARPVADDSLLLDLLPTLKVIVAAHTQQLTYANQTLLNSLITRIEHSDKPLAKITINEVKAQTTLSINQQILEWIKAKDATALYGCASTDSTDVSVRVRAVEALGQIHEPKIEQWLESLMNDDDDDIQKLAYKVLRRWQRAMVRAQQKRPSTFASTDLNNSKNNSAIAGSSNQGAGENK